MSTVIIISSIAIFITLILCLINWRLSLLIQHYLSTGDVEKGSWPRFWGLFGLTLQFWSVIEIERLSHAKYYRFYRRYHWILYRLGTEKEAWNYDVKLFIGIKRKENGVNI